MIRLKGSKKLVRNLSEKWLSMRNYIDFVTYVVLKGFLLGWQNNSVRIEILYKNHDSVMPLSAACQHLVASTLKQLYAIAALVLCDITGSVGVTENGLRTFAGLCDFAGTDTGADVE